MFKRILVPTDGSALASGILGPLTPFLHQENPTLVLLRVLEPKHYDGPTEQKQQEADAKERMGRLSELLEGEGCSVEFKVEFGDPVARILHHAKSADLLAMSTHARTGVARWFHGSVTETVLRDVKTPVLVSNPSGLGPHQRFRNLLITVPDEPAAAKALGEFAATLAVQQGAKATLLRIGSWEGDWALDASPAGANPDALPLLPSALDLKQQAQVAAAPLKAAKVATEVRIGWGKPADGILGLATELGCDLVVLGTHGYHGLERLMYGSVSEAVVRHAKCPALVAHL
ncbi:MAG: universal stress protein, partial [Planctomycetes bacterium]|nr:universal stress protein [Planctomycetota bacterium]